MLQLVIKPAQLRIILFLLRHRVDKANELLMDVLQDRLSSGPDPNMLARERLHSRSHCRWKLIHALVDATLGSS